MYMYIVYILKSEVSEGYYIGVTSDINKRLKAHNSGANRSTKSKRPWKVVHKEAYENKKDAWQRERLIKSYKGGVAFKKLLYGEVA